MPRRLLLAAVTTLTTTAAMPAGALAARVTVPTRAPSLRQGLADLGPASAQAPVDALVGLAGRDDAGLRAFVSRVSDPSSPQYGHYLTPPQVRSRFAASDATVAAVTGWLRAAGLTTEVPANRTFVHVTGTAAQAEQAFGLLLRQVRDTAGATVLAPASAATVPAALRGLVTSISGLDQSDEVRSDAQTAPPAIVQPGPCTRAFGQARSDAPGGDFQVTCGYDPGQLQSAYGVAPVIKAGVDGRGVKVAIIDPYDFPQLAQDVQTYSQRHGLPPAQFVRRTDLVATNTPTLPGGVVDPDDAVPEQALDVEAVHTMAPGATIVYQAADSLLNANITMAQNSVVADHAADIVSNSYGGAGDGYDPMNDQIFMQGAAEGMGFYFSSGDAGDETDAMMGVGDREVDDFANSPYVTAVGGTALGISASGQRQFETYWGNRSQTLTNGSFPAADTFAGGGGGGVSQSYGQPDWQKGVVPDSVASYFKGKPLETNADNGPVVPGRAVPDVSMLGDPNTGMLVGHTQDFTKSSNLAGQTMPGDDVHYGEFRVGGTSLSAPLLAGMMALADQAAGKPHGFVNPALYAAYKGDRDIVLDPRVLTAPAAVVRRNYVNSTDASGGTDTLRRRLDVPATLHQLDGYDDSTGLGVPRGAAFLAALAPGSATLRTLAASAPPVSGTAPGSPVSSALPGLEGCPTLTYVLSTRATRVTKVGVFIDGKQVKSRRGHRLTRVTFPRGDERRLRVRVDTVRSGGTRLRSVRTYANCTQTGRKITALHR